jgi:hypothetical protein
MRAQVPECPKCKRPMSVGFVLEHGHNERRGVTHWVEGLPEKSFWAGLVTKNRRVLPITTWRCERCGFLESYAHPAPPP